MIQFEKIVWLLTSMILFVVPCVVLAETESELPAALEAFEGYEYGHDKAVLHEARMAVFRRTDDDSIRRINEQVLLSFLQSKASTAARREACLWLGYLASDASRPLLSELAEDERFADVAQIALDTLIRTEPCTVATDNPLEQFKASALAASDPMDMLTEALQGDDETIARLAFELIGEGLSTHEACVWIVENIQKLNTTRQLVAMNVLLQLGRAEQHAVVAQLSREGDDVVKLAAVRELGRVGKTQDMVYLNSLWNGTDEALSAAAANAIRLLPDATVKEVILENLGSSDIAIQQRAIEMLELRVGVYAADMLSSIALNDESPNQHAAIAAQGMVLSPGSFEAILDRYVKSEGHPTQKAWQSATWLLARRQPSYEKAVAILEEQEVSATMRKGLDGMIKKLNYLRPEVSVKALQPVEMSPAPAKMRQDRPNPNLLLPGSYLDVLPKRFKVAAYLNCGMASEVKGQEVSIRNTNGEPYNNAPDTDPSVSLHYARASLDYEVSGLNPYKEYLIGFTWWDSGERGRRQALNINGEEILPETPAIAYDSKADRPKAQRLLGKGTPARIQLVIPAGAIESGKCTVSVQRVAGPNAVNSELWIAERVQAKADKQVLIVTGQDFPGHRWRRTSSVLQDLITEDERMEVTICESPHAVSLKHLDYYDVVFVHFKNYEASMPSTDAVKKRLAAFVNNGGGMCLSHFACGAYQEWPEFVNLSGRVWNGEGHDKRGPFTVKIVDPDHPVTHGLEDFETYDELYFCLKGDPEVHVLCDAFSQKKQADHPQAIVFEPEQGRVFLSTLGHDTQAYEPQAMQQLFRQGTAWAAGLAVAD